jgi:hypothetical protein
VTPSFQTERPQDVYRISPNEQLEAQLARIRQQAQVDGLTEDAALCFVAVRQ